MFNGVMMAGYGMSQGSFYSGGIGDFLNELQSQGFFQYLLPFLLIFALVYGILSRIKLFAESKEINGIIALVVGLMALQFDFVPYFFAELFPRFGVALAIILVLLISVGLFVDPKKGWIMYSLLGVGILIFILVLVSTAGALSWQQAGWWYDNWKGLIGIIVILVAVGVVVGGGSHSGSGSGDYKPIWPFGVPTQ